MKACSLILAALLLSSPALAQPDPSAVVAAERAFAADGMAVAALDVDTQNPSGAHGLYASLGYTERHGSRLLTIEL